VIRVACGGPDVVISRLSYEVQAGKGSSIKVVGRSVDAAETDEMCRLVALE
jgi:hypothetical protein